ncbi:MAG: hypothetical protein HYU66_22640 [Armatimonadetes bacterium]|nr:hypothetical protein [Armatimonadota bacterium]
MSEQPTDGPEGAEDESNDEQPDAAGGGADDSGAAGEPLPDRVTTYTYDDTGCFVLVAESKGCRTEYTYDHVAAAEGSADVNGEP